MSRRRRAIVTPRPNVRGIVARRDVASGALRSSAPRWRWLRAARKPAAEGDRPARMLTSRDDPCYGAPRFPPSTLCSHWSRYRAHLSSLAASMPSRERVSFPNNK